jgi:hypothetical protein
MRLQSEIILLIVGVLTVAAHAVEKNQSKPDKVVYEKNTKLDFEERSVDGQFQSPDSRDVQGEKNIYFDSMLEERNSFQKEMKRSSGAVR